MPTSYYWDITKKDVKTATVWGNDKCNEGEIMVVHGPLGKIAGNKVGDKVFLSPFDKVHHISLNTLSLHCEIKLEIAPGSLIQFQVHAEVGIDENQIIDKCTDLVKKRTDDVKHEVSGKLVSLVKGVSTSLVKNNALNLQNFVNDIKAKGNSALLPLGLSLKELKVTNFKGDHGFLKVEASEKKEDKLALLRKEGKEKLTNIVLAHKAVSEELKNKEDMLEIYLKQLPLMIQELLKNEESTIEQQAAQILMAEATAEATRIEGDANAEVILATEKARVENLKSQAEKYKNFDGSHFTDVKLEILQKAVEGVTEVLQPHADALREAIPPSEYVKDIMKIVEATPHMIEWMTGVDILSF